LSLFVVKFKSLNPAYRQAGTKDHKVRKKVSQRKNKTLVTS
jgi:hypothetical protein